MIWSDRNNSVTWGGQRGRIRVWRIRVVKLITTTIFDGDRKALNSSYFRAVFYMKRRDLATYRKIRQARRRKRQKSRLTR